MRIVGKRGARTTPAFIPEAIGIVRSDSADTKLRPAARDMSIILRLARHDRLTAPLDGWPCVPPH